MRADKAYETIREFLGPDLNFRLLDFVLANESRFEQSGVGKTGSHDPTFRVSSILSDLGPFKALIEQRVLDLVPSLIMKLGLTPFTPTGVEIEAAAHGEGAFYRRHIDLFTAAERNEEADRLISLVYYFHKDPKSFSGGLLRLYPSPGVAGRLDEPATDVTPEQDLAIAFSSWMPHEILPVSCPSGRFSDSRFAINCWVLRARTPVAHTM